MIQTHAAQAEKRFKQAVNELAENQRRLEVAAESLQANVSAQGKALAEVVAAREQYGSCLTQEQLMLAISGLKEEIAAPKRKLAQEAEQKAEDQAQKKQKEEEKAKEEDAQKESGEKKQAQTPAQAAATALASVKEEADFDEDARPPGPRPDEKTAQADSDGDSEGWQIAGKSDAEKAVARARRDTKRAGRSAAPATAQRRLEWLGAIAQQKKAAAAKQAQRAASAEPQGSKAGAPAQSRPQSLPPRQAPRDRRSRAGQNLFSDFPVVQSRLNNRGPPSSPEALEEDDPFKALAKAAQAEPSSESAEPSRSPAKGKGEGKKGKGKEKGKDKGKEKSREKGAGKGAGKGKGPGKVPAFDCPSYSAAASHSAGYKVHVCDIGHAEKFTKNMVKDFLRECLHVLDPSSRPTDYNVIQDSGRVRYTPLHGSAQAIVTFASEPSCRMGHSLLNNATWHHDGEEGLTQAFFCGPEGTRNK